MLGNQGDNKDKIKLLGSCILAAVSLIQPHYVTAQDGAPAQLAEIFAPHRESFDGTYFESEYSYSFPKSTSPFASIHMEDHIDCGLSISFRAVRFGVHPANDPRTTTGHPHTDKVNIALSCTTSGFSAESIGGRHGVDNLQLSYLVNKADILSSRKGGKDRNFLYSSIKDKDPYDGMIPLGGDDSSYPKYVGSWGLRVFDVATDRSETRTLSTIDFNYHKASVEAVLCGVLVDNKLMTMSQAQEIFDKIDGAGEGMRSKRSCAKQNAPKSRR